VALREAVGGAEVCPAALCALSSLRISKRTEDSESWRGERRKKKRLFCVPNQRKGAKAGYRELGVESYKYRANWGEGGRLEEERTGRAKGGKGRKKMQPF